MAACIPPAGQPSPRPPSGYRGPDGGLHQEQRQERPDELIKGRCDIARRHRRLGRRKNRIARLPWRRRTNSKKERVETPRDVSTLCLTEILATS